MFYAVHLSMSTENYYPLNNRITVDACPAALEEYEFVAGAVAKVASMHSSGWSSSDVKTAAPKPEDEGLHTKSWQGRTSSKERGVMPVAPYSYNYRSAFGHRR